MVHKLKKKKIYKKHVSQRLHERVGVGLSALEKNIKSGAYYNASRLTSTRTLCITKLDGKFVWFLMRRPKIVITIIPNTDHKVKRLLKDHTGVQSWMRKHESKKEVPRINHVDGDNNRQAQERTNK